MGSESEQFAVVEAWITTTCEYIMDKQFYFLGVYFSWYDVIVAGGIFYIFGMFLWHIVIKYIDSR